MSIVSWTLVQASAWSGRVGVHGRQGRHATRAIAELAQAVETGGDVEQAVQAAFRAGLEPYEIAELSGLPMRRVLKILGQPKG